MHLHRAMSMMLMTSRLSVQHCRLDRPALQICRLCALLHQVADGMTLPITCMHEHGHGWVACAPYDDLQQLLILLQLNAFGLHVQKCASGFHRQEHIEAALSLRIIATISETCLSRVMSVMVPRTPSEDLRLAPPLQSHGQRPAQPSSAALLFVKLLLAALASQLRI